MGEGTWQVEIYSHEIFFFQTLKAKTTRRKKNLPHFNISKLKTV